jgi:catechol 2,3-dioxygenase-like lactoylglutathione lyase family enzyme
MELPRARLALSFASALLVSALSQGGGEENPLPEPVKVGRMPVKIVAESSGLCKSATKPKLFFTHGDSGNPARVHAVDAQGKLLFFADVTGAKNVDWEEIAMDEKGRLILADFGDNGRRRKEICLYRWPEPAGAEVKSAPAAQAFRFRYPDDVGSQDAEGMVVLDGAACLFTKEFGGTRCFSAPLPDEPPKDAVTLSYCGRTDRIRLVTAAALDPEGRALALLTYSKLLVVSLPERFRPTPDDASEPPEKKLFGEDAKFRERALHGVGQVEAITWDGEDLLMSNENGDLWLVKQARPAAPGKPRIEPAD